MTGDDTSHDTAHAHPSSPVAGTIVGVIIALIFGQAFALLNNGTWETGVVIAFVLLVAHMLYNLWVVDRD